MSSPNTSASQTDNCRDSKAISLSQPISSLPPPAGDGRPEPTAPDRITDKRWQHICCASPTRKFRMYAHLGSRCELPRIGLLNAARGFGKQFAVRQCTVHSVTGSSNVHDPQGCGRVLRAVPEQPASRPANGLPALETMHTPTGKYSRHHLTNAPMARGRFHVADLGCLLKGNTHAVWKNRRRKPLQGFRRTATRSNRPAQAGLEQGQDPCREWRGDRRQRRVLQRRGG